MGIGDKKVRGNTEKYARKELGCARTQWQYIRERRTIQNMKGEESQNNGTRLEGAIGYTTAHSRRRPVYRLPNKDLDTSKFGLAFLQLLHSTLELLPSSVLLPALVV